MASGNENGVGCCVEQHNVGREAAPISLCPLWDCGTLRAFLASEKTDRREEMANWWHYQLFDFTGVSVAPCGELPRLAEAFVTKWNEFERSFGAPLRWLVLSQFVDSARLEAERDGLSVGTVMFSLMEEACDRGGCVSTPDSSRHTRVCASRWTSALAESSPHWNSLGMCRVPLSSDVASVRQAVFVLLFSLTAVGVFADAAANGPLHRAYDRFYPMWVQLIVEWMVLRRTPQDTM